MTIAILRSPRAGAEALALVAATVLLSVPGPALAQARGHAAEGAGIAVLPAKPKAADPAIAAGAGSPVNDSHTHLSREGGIERRLWIDNRHIAEFGDDGAPAIRVAAPDEVEAARRGSDATQAGLKSQAQSARQSPAAAPGAAVKPVSPVFKDTGGRLRALPGGVIVSFKQPLADEEARSTLEAAGLVPLRQIGERMWLVDSPAGIASLELANRLQEEGRFGFAQPNWWQPKVTK